MKKSELLVEWADQVMDEISQFSVTWPSPSLSPGPRTSLYRWGSSEHVSRKRITGVVWGYVFTMQERLRCYLCLFGVFILNLLYCFLLIALLCWVIRGSRNMTPPLIGGLEKLLNGTRHVLTKVFPCPFCSMIPETLPLSYHKYADVFFKADTLPHRPYDCLIIRTPRPMRANKTPSAHTLIVQEHFATYSIAPHTI